MGLRSAVKKRLERELLTVIIILLVIMFGIFTLISIRRNTDNMIKMEKQKIDLMAVSLTKSIQDMMITGNANIVGGWATDLKEIHEVKSIQVLKNDGSEAFKDNTTIEQVNKHMGGEAFKKAYDNEPKKDHSQLVDKARFEETLNTAVKVSYFETLGGEEVLTQLTPLANEERCSGCHGYDKHKVRAVLRISAPVKEVRSAIATNMWVTIGISILIIILTSIAIKILIKVLVVKPMKGILGVVSSLSSGDLTNTVNMKTLNPENEMGELAKGFNYMAGNIRGIIEKIDSGTTELVSSSGGFAMTAVQIARGAEEQSAKVSQVSSASQELSSTIADIAKNASIAAGAATTAKDTAAAGGGIVARTIESMNGISQTARNSSEVVSELSERSQEIGKIILVIDDIADQTNLLALNAAIEAARAGEQGRGFAVVADEVRKLAERTTKATKEIDGMIKTIQAEIGKALESMNAEIEAVGEGVSLAHEAGGALTEIISEVDKVAFMVSQIAAATEEHTAVAEHINSDIDGVAAITQETSRSAQQIAGVFQGIADTIASIRASVAGFKISQVTYGRDLSELKSMLNRVRAGVVGMLTQKDKAVIETQHELIKKLNNEINEKFKALVHNADMPEGLRAQVTEADGIWQEFAKVRDTQLFPAIYAGRLQESKELALGAQAQRFKKFMAIVDAMLEK